MSNRAQDNSKIYDIFLDICKDALDERLCGSFRRALHNLIRQNHIETGYHIKRSNDVNINYVIVI